MRPTFILPTWFVERRLPCGQWGYCSHRIGIVCSASISTTATRALGSNAQFERHFSNRYLPFSNKPPSQTNLLHSRFFPTRGYVPMRYGLHHVKGYMRQDVRSLASSFLIPSQNNLYILIHQVLSQPLLEPRCTALGPDCEDRAPSARS